jgi:hypothetical protein
VLVAGLAHAIALAGRHARAQIAAAGRGQDALASAYAGEPGITTETVDFIDEASIRVSAVSPGVADTAVCGTLGEKGNTDYFADMSVRNPAWRFGTAGDIADGVLFALTSAFSPA